MSSGRTKLVKIIDPVTYSKELGDKKIVFEMVMDIFKKMEYEVPNSATFTMALDSLVENENIYYIEKERRKAQKIEEVTFKK